MVILVKCRTANTLEHWLDFRFKLFLEGILIGLAAGIVVVAYRVLLEKAEILRAKIYEAFTILPPAAVLLWFLALCFIALLLGLLGRYDPMVGGSGIPQVKGQLASLFTVGWLHVIFGKFVGGLLAIGAGLSLGREGPSVQLGAAVGQGTGRLLGRTRLENKYLITSGASAGLAAAFGAPLAGVMFALEELHKNFSPIVLTSAMAASLTADFLSQNFFGQKPVLEFPSLPLLPLNHFPFLIVLGLIIGLLGIFFNFSLMKTLELMGKSGIPSIWKPLPALLTAGLLGFVLPEVLGGGHHLINSLGASDRTLTVLLVLAVVKFAFTMLSYGSGAPGGIFLPLLVIGALIGNIFGDTVQLYFHVDPRYVNNFIVLSMAAYFTAIVKAPITGSILITEMTGSFSHLLSMATVSMTAYLVTDLLHSKPVYELLLARIIARRGRREWNHTEYNKAILEIPVCLGSQLDQKRIMDISWPKDCLLIAIKRGEAEIIPRGLTKIRAGDYLVVLTNEEREGELMAYLQELAGECLD